MTPAIDKIFAVFMVTILIVPPDARGRRSQRVASVGPVPFSKRSGPRATPQLSLRARRTIRFLLAGVASELARLRAEPYMTGHRALSSPKRTKGVERPPRGIPY